MNPDELRLLFECYKALYPREEIELCSSVARKFSNVLLGTEKFGSKLDCRNLRSARIMASWSGDDGLIDTSVPYKTVALKYVYPIKIYDVLKCEVLLFLVTKWRKIKISKLDIF